MTRLCRERLLLWFYLAELTQREILSIFRGNKGVRGCDPPYIICTSNNKRSYTFDARVFCARMFCARSSARLFSEARRGSGSRPFATLRGASERARKVGQNAPISVSNGHDLTLLRSS